MTVDLKERIIGIALRHLYDYGINDLDMDRLLSAIQIDRGTLESLYPTKEDLVEAVILNTLDNIQQLFRAISNKAGLPITTLYEYDLIMASTFYNHTQFTLSHELKESYPHIFDTIMDRTQNMMRTVYQTNYMRGFQLGYYKQFSDIDDMIEEQVSSNGILHKWDTNLSNPELRTENQKLVDKWLDKITTQKGKEEIKKIEAEVKAKQQSKD